MAVQGKKAPGERSRSLLALELGVPVLELGESAVGTKLQEGTVVGQELWAIWGGRPFVTDTE